jgi:hypothetical protein
VPSSRGATIGLYELPKAIADLDEPKVLKLAEEFLAAEPRVAVLRKPRSEIL